MDSFGFALSMPPGALEEGETCVISIQILTYSPDPLDLRGNEMLASLPFKCSPSDKIFRKPIKISMPQCAILRNPEEVELIIILQEDKGNVEIFISFAHNCIPFQFMFSTALL